MAADQSSDEAGLSKALKKMGARTDPIIGLLDQLQGAMFWIKDLKGRFTWVNTAAILLRGVRSRADLLGKTDLDLNAPARANQFRYDDLYVQAGNPIHGRIERLEINHVSQWFSTSKVPLSDGRGRVVGTAGLAIPITRTGRKPGEGPLLADAIHYIDKHFHEPIKNTVLARVCGMSLGNFQRQFHSTYHCSPHTYVRGLRVRLSCQALVHTDHSLATIAEEHGFSDQSHFTKEFRRMMKETPRAYRQRFRK